MAGSGFPTVGGVRGASAMNPQTSDIHRPLRLDVLTLFPEMFPGVLGSSILRRAAEAGAVSYHVHDIRASATNKHGKVDQPPFGGGPGMVMQCQPVWDCVEAVEALDAAATPTRVLLTPQGRPLDQPTVERLAASPRLLLIAGHYEGLDERVIEAIRERPGGLEEISIGDYVLSGGELPAMVLIDAVVRLRPGVLGDDRSAEHDSFSPGSQRLLDHPHYTRPRTWHGHEVPGVLLEGDHAKIDAWRAEQRRERTAARRPELLAGTGRDRAACVVLRDEAKDDARAIHRVHVEAFGTAEEADLVDALRHAGDAAMSVVAEATTPRGVEIVGHALLSPATLAEQPGVVGYLGLAPVAVRPAWKNRGIGSAIVRRLIDRARQAAARAVFVLGDPAYYGRFGFEPAYPRGFACRFVAPDAPQGPGTAERPGRDSFRVLALRPIDPHHTGPIRFAPAIEALGESG